MLRAALLPGFQVHSAASAKYLPRYSITLNPTGLTLNGFKSLHSNPPGGLGAPPRGFASKIVFLLKHPFERCGKPLEALQAPPPGGPLEDLEAIRRPSPWRPPVKTGA